MNNVKSSGPRIEPCGTLTLTVLQVETSLSTITRCFLSLRTTALLCLVSHSDPFCKQQVMADRAKGSTEVY